MIIGIQPNPIQRTASGTVPAFVSNLTNAKLEVHVEKGAGAKPVFLILPMKSRVLIIVAERTQLFSLADVLLQLHGLSLNSATSQNDLELIHSGQTVVGLFNPLGSPADRAGMCWKRAYYFALELLPRISRAQPMDVLSSMATIAGYKAVLLAASALNKIYPMMITAAGTITPSRVFVVGAGVAGLQAIATARRLGAVVQSYDIRPAVKEQVESLGAKFLVLELETEEAETSGGYAKAMDEEFYRRQREMMKQVVAESDVVITTAAIPGKKSPVLVTEEMVRGMHSGSVIVDLAAEGGGNCELTQPGETLNVNGVHILGPLNLPSTIPHHASQMYSKNVTSFLENLYMRVSLTLIWKIPL
jgi:NAD(P) transhydrogenase subunit alpha